MYSAIIPRALEQYGHKVIANPNSQWGYYMQGMENECTGNCKELHIE